MADITIPGGRIRSFVERIEHLDAELQELTEQKKEIFLEAKGALALSGRAIRRPASSRAPT
jgi:uncharacterized protein (UPF0335 family)